MHFNNHKNMLTYFCKETMFFRAVKVYEKKKVYEKQSILLNFCKSLYYTA